MSTKDISDVQVLQAYVDAKADPARYADEVLQDRTGQPWKVCWSAMNRALKRDLIDYGVSLRSGFLTDKSKALLEASN